jgi:hypothetical protein
MVDQVTELASRVNMDNSTVVLQLFDNSVYIVGGPGGEKRLPGRDRLGTYHVDGSLVVADKAAIKDLVNQLTPLFRMLGGSRKIYLTPLARYWVALAAATLAMRLTTIQPGSCQNWETLSQCFATSSEMPCSSRRFPTSGCFARNR